MDDSIPKYTFKDPCIIPFTNQIRYTEIKPAYTAKADHGYIEGSDLATIGLILVLITVVVGTSLGFGISWIIRGCP